MRAAGAARLVASLTVVGDQMKIQAAGRRGPKGRGSAHTGTGTHWRWEPAEVRV